MLFNFGKKSGGSASVKGKPIEITVNSKKITTDGTGPVNLRKGIMRF